MWLPTSTLVETAKSPPVDLGWHSSNPNPLRSGSMMQARRSGEGWQRQRCLLLQQFAPSSEPLSCERRPLAPLTFSFGVLTNDE
jgi:hypothetical protein